MGCRLRGILDFGVLEYNTVHYKHVGSKGHVRINTVQYSPNYGLQKRRERPTASFDDMVTSEASDHLLSKVNRAGSWAELLGFDQ